MVIFKENPGKKQQEKITGNVVRNYDKLSNDNAKNYGCYCKNFLCGSSQKVSRFHHPHH